MKKGLDFFLLHVRVEEQNQIRLSVNGSGEIGCGNEVQPSHFYIFCKSLHIVRILETLRFQKDPYLMFKKFGTHRDPFDSLEGYHRSLVNKAF